MQIFKKQDGFTFLELLVVLSIIIVILGVAVPTFAKTLERQALASFSKQLAGDIRYVRQMNTNGNLLMRIQISNNRYIIREGIKVIEIKTAPKGVRFMNELALFIHFNALGVPIGAGATTINLTNSYGHIYQVIITVHTGRVRFQPHPEKW